MSSAPDFASSHVLIRDTLARIAACSDTGTIEDYLACFTPDAVWQLTAAEGLPMETTTLTGSAEIRASVENRRLAGVQGPGSHTAHQVSTTHVTFIDAATATASSLFLFYTGTKSTPKLAGIGRYSDTFVWSESAWLLRARIITQG